MTLPTKIMHSTTAGNAPASLLSGQIALNEQDRKFYYLDPQAAAPKSLLDQLTALSTTQNLLINSGMQIDQSHAGGAVTGITGIARWDGVNISLVASPTVVLTGQQVADAPTGYYNSLKASVTTAQASIAATQSIGFVFIVEGFRTAKLAWGTASAQSVVVGFWVKANRTGQYGGAITDGSGTRSYPFAFTIAAAGVWQYVTAVISGETTGVNWQRNTNSASIWLNITMAAGTSASATAGVWNTGTTVSVTGNVNGVAATTDYMNVTGVTLHVGNIVVPVERAPFLMPHFDDALRSCYRYYESSYGQGIAPGTVSDDTRQAWSITGATGIAYSVVYRVTKRAAPTVTWYSPATLNASGKFRDYNGAADIATASLFTNAPGGFDINIGSFPNFGFQWTADARI
jgi:hypothetical protein